MAASSRSQSCISKVSPPATFIYIRRPEASSNFWICRTRYRQPHDEHLAMCLILFASKVHPQYSLVLAANRDESYARPTARAAFWQDDPRIYGGRDLAQGGTWLGINLDGAFAAVTNYRSG